MPPKQASKQGSKQQAQGGTNGPSDQERSQEAQKAAQSSLKAQKKAQELTQAAAGAGDPNERQKLLNEALNHEIEAESFGKTAKYLQTGTFQGLIAGGGLGTGVGAGLGTITGTLVGGVSSLITGGLGGAIGSAVGAIHGPFVKIGDLAGNGIRKITGDLPGWEATEEQKGQLETMIGQVHEQPRPSEKDLEGWSSGTGMNLESAVNTGKQAKQASSWVPSKDSLPSMPSWGGGKEQDNAKEPGRAQNLAKDQTTNAVQAGKEQGTAKSSQGKPGPDERQQAQAKQTRQGNVVTPVSKRPTNQVSANGESQKRQTRSSAQQNSTPAMPNIANGDGNTPSSGGQATAEKKKPKKLETRQSPASEPKKKPRKLQSRS